MEKDIPLKLETLTHEQDEKFRIFSPKEIRFVMQYISEKGNRVALYYDNNNSILTTLLTVDDSGMWLEQSQNASDNKFVIESNQLTFVSSHLQIKVQFTAKKASSVLYQGSPAFYLPMPHGLYRLQRREFYRLATPITNPLHCVIAKDPSPDKKPREFIIMDISCGGVGLTCMETDTELVPGQSYSDCKIELPEVGTISGTIEVKNLVVMPSNSSKPHKRAGCEFKHLDGASMILLQRYITNMQRTKNKI